RSSAEEEVAYEYEEEVQEQDKTHVFEVCRKLYKTLSPDSI
ncbi:hypothetical protein L195_g064638, partial [Trifolium pratense]